MTMFSLMSEHGFCVRSYIVYMCFIINSCSGETNRQCLVVHATGMTPEHCLLSRHVKGLNVYDELHALKENICDPVHKKVPDVYF